MNFILRGDKLQPDHQVVDWSENDLFVNIFLLAKAGEFLIFLIKVEDLECKAEEAPARHSNFAFNLPGRSKANLTHIQLRSLPRKIDVILHILSSPNIFDSRQRH